jgi:hypothetical protein
MDVFLLIAPNICAILLTIIVCLTARDWLDAWHREYIQRLKRRDAELQIMLHWVVTGLPATDHTPTTQPK